LLIKPLKMIVGQSQSFTAAMIRYPWLSQLATKYLATSVPSEQTFSAAGNIANIK